MHNFGIMKLIRLHHFSSKLKNPFENGSSEVTPPQLLDSV